MQKVSSRTIERDYYWLKDKGIIFREEARSDGRWIIFLSRRLFASDLTPKILEMAGIDEANETYGGYIR